MGLQRVHETELTDSTPTWRLFVAWQDPDTRAMHPVGRLDRVERNGQTIYSFAYLRNASGLSGFRPFVNFPDLNARYEAPFLFPFFENRLMPRERADYAEFLQSLALGIEADPFEVLARSGGKRATDTVEVFPEPIQRNGHAQTLFLARVTHIPHAIQDTLELRPGTRLMVMHDLQNDYDEYALILRTDENKLVGFLPIYLAPVVHRCIQQFGRDAVRVEVEHVADPQAPMHMRLLCRMFFQWNPEHPFFDDPSFVPILTDEQVDS